MDKCLKKCSDRSGTPEYLPSLQILPGRFEFTYLPTATQAATNPNPNPNPHPHPSPNPSPSPSPNPNPNPNPNPSPSPNPNPNLPTATQAVLLVPLPGVTGGAIILGADQARAFKEDDVAWARTVASGLGAWMSG